MIAPATFRPVSASTLWRGAVWGGLIGASIDLCFVMSWLALHGKSPLLAPEVIASGFLGTRAFDGGVGVVVLGVVSHYAIVLVAALLFGLAARGFPLLRERAWLYGPMFGLAIFLTMRFVIVPLSNAPPLKSSALALTLDLIVHLFGIGWPIAAFARKVANAQ